MGGGGKGGGSADLSGALNAQMAAIQKATDAINKYSGMSIEQLQQSYQTSQQQLKDYTALGMTQTSPYNFAGTNALDAYNATLGIGAPKGGSFNLQQSLAGQQQYDRQLSDFNAQQAAAKGTTGAVGDYAKAVNALSSNVGYGEGSKAAPYGNFQNIAPGNATDAQKSYNDFKAYTESLQKELDTGKDPTGASIRSDHMGTIKQNLVDANKILEQYKGGFETTPGVAPTNPLTADQQATAAAYKAGTLGTEAVANPLAGFAGSAQGKLMNYNKDQSVLENFYNSNPSFQFQQQQMNQGINAAASSQGMLNNPNLLRSLQNYNQNLASTTFGQYQQNLGQAFGGYQASLANLAGAGQQVATNNQNAQTGLGQNLAQGTTTQGQDIASIYGNQGAQLANAQLGGGQAMATSYMNQANLAQQQSAGGSALGGLVGKGIGTYFGGGIGGAIGSGLGGLAGSLF